MHIVLYSPAWPPGKTANGIITYCNYLVPELESLGHTVSVICGRQEGDAKNTYVVDMQSLPVWDRIIGKVLRRMSPAWRTRYLGGKALRKLVGQIHAKLKIDILEIEESFGWCGVLAKSFDFPVVTRLHGPFFLNGNLGQKFSKEVDFAGRVKMESIGFEGIQYVTAPSQDVLDRTKAQTRCSWPLERVIPNPIEENPPEAMWDPNKVVRGQILFVGRFDMHKGGDIVLRAFEQLVAQKENVKLIFVGPDKGVNVDGIVYSYPEFVQKFLSSSAREKVDYKGLVPLTEVLSYRLSSEFTVLAARYENFPYAALESIAAGAPTICPNIGGFLEIVDDRVNGLHFNAGDPTALSHAMLELIDNPDTARAYAQQAAETVGKKFTPKRVTQATIDFYQDVLERGT